MANVKVYGIQRSGNNWLMYLLAANFRVEVLGNKKAGGTHDEMNVVGKLGKEPTAVMLAVKHPLCWLPSIWKYRGKDEPFTSYVQHSDEIERWNEKYRGWLDGLRKLNTAGKVIMRYEEWVADPTGKLEEAGRALKLERKDQPWQVPQGAMGMHMSPTSSPFHPDFYTQRKFMRYYSRRLIQEVTERLDGSVLLRLGYGG